MSGQLKDLLALFLVLIDGRLGLS